MQELQQIMRSSQPSSPMNVSTKSNARSGSSARREGESPDENLAVSIPSTLLPVSRASEGSQPRQEFVKVVPDEEPFALSDVHRAGLVKR